MLRTSSSRVGSSLLLAGLMALHACGGESTPTAAPVVSTISIAGNEAALLPGATQQLTARGLTSSGAVVASAVISWSSANGAVASVSSAGVVQALAAGTAVITASSGSASATTEIRVNAGGVVAATGGNVTAASGNVALTFPAGAVTTTTPVTVTTRADTVRTAHTVSPAYVFGPTGAQFAQPVTLALKFDAAALPAHTDKASLRVARLVNGAWEPLTEGVQIDSTTNTVRALTRSFSTYAVVRDPCLPQDGSATVITGGIAADDCLFRVAGRRSDYYTIKPPANQMFVLKSSGSLDGLFGLKQATNDVSTGTVYDAKNIGSEIRFVGNGDALQLFVSGRDSTKLGSYTFTKSAAVSHECPNTAAGVPTVVLMPGARYSDNITSSNSCKPTVQFSPIPSAIGQQLLAHYYAVKLDAGRQYTVTANGLAPQSALSIFYNGLVAQSVSFTSSLRTVSFTAAASAYYVIEISSGGFVNPDLSGGWTNPLFAYTVSVSAPAASAKR